MSKYEEKLEEVLEAFYGGYDRDFSLIHTRHKNGEISIEQQVELSEDAWDKRAKEAKNDIRKFFIDTTKEAKPPKVTPNRKTNVSDVMSSNGYNWGVDTFEKNILSLLKDGE
jgi:hypothetical protein